MSESGIITAAEMYDRVRSGLTIKKLNELDRLGTEQQAREVLNKVVLSECVIAANKSKKAICVRLFEKDMGPFIVPISNQRVLAGMRCLLLIAGYRVTIHEPGLDEYCRMDITWIPH